MNPAAMQDLAKALATTRGPIAHARTLPAAVYTAPEILAIEQAGLFARTWLCVGREADIPGTGDFFTRELAGDSVIVLRGADGLVRLRGLAMQAAADATPSGGLLVGWGDTRLAPTISFRLRWLIADLTPDPDMPDSGRVVFPVSPYTSAGSMLAVHSDGDDAAFVAWAAYSTVELPNGQLWMTHVPAPAVLVWRSVAELVGDRGVDAHQVETDLNGQGGGRIRARRSLTRGGGVCREKRQERGGDESHDHRPSFHGTPRN